MAFIVGILFGSAYQSLWILAIVAVCACTAAIFKKYLQAAWIIAFGLGVFNVSNVVPPTDLAAYEKTELFYRASIISVTSTDNSQSAVLEIHGIGLDSVNVYSHKKMRVRISLPSFEKELLPGHGIDFYAKFGIRESIMDLPDEYDMKESLRRRFIAMTALIEPDQIASIYPLNDIVSQAKRLRYKLTTLLYRTTLSSSAKEFLNTTLLGDTSDLSKETREVYTASGLSHILALSGLHVGIIAAFIALVLCPIRLFGYRHIVMVATIVLLWLYALVTGFSPSVTRAVIMTSLLLIGKVTQRRNSSMNALMAAALLILIFSPEELFSIGFQLSFAAVLSILLFSRKINPINPRHTVAYAIFSYVEMSISAMIGTAIMSAYYFHTMPVYFLIGNLAVAILLPLIIGGGLLLMIAASLGINSWVLCDAVSGLHSVMFYIANWVADLPSSTIKGIYISGWIIWIYAIAVFLLYLWLSKRTLRYGIAFGITIIAIMATLLYQPNPNRIPQVYIAREAYRTDLIIDNCSDSLYIFTTAPDEPNTVIERAKFRYADYMGKRQINGIKIVDDDTISRPGFAIFDNCLKFGSMNIAIISRKIPNTIQSTNYLLVCRGYQDDIEDAIAKFNPDTVIIGYDLHYRRALRCKTVCSKINKPFIDLRESAWSLKFQ